MITVGITSRPTNTTGAEVVINLINKLVMLFKITPSFTTENPKYETPPALKGKFIKLWVKALRFFNLPLAHVLKDVVINLINIISVLSIHFSVIHVIHATVGKWLATAR